MGHDQVPTCQCSFLVNKGDMSFIIMLTYEIQFASKTLPIKHFKKLYYCTNNIHRMAIHGIKKIVGHNYLVKLILCIKKIQSFLFCIALLI